MPSSSRATAAMTACRSIACSGAWGSCPTKRSPICARRWRRLRPVELFLLVLGVTSVGMYCYLGEKVPWLGVIFMTEPW